MARKTSAPSVVTTHEVFDVPLNQLHVDPNNLRLTYDEADIAELAQSIEQNGLLTPLSVRPADETNQWFVNAGNRRLCALQQLVKKRKLAADAPILCVESGGVERRDVAATQLVENLQRVDLNPIEEAIGFLELTTIHGLKQAELAVRVGRAPSHITKRLALLKLPDDVQARVIEGKLDVGLAYELTRVSDPDLFDSLCKQAAKGRLQDYEVSNALRRQESAARAAKLTKWLEDHGVTTVLSAPAGWWEMPEVGEYNSLTIKDYAPKKNHVVLRRGADSDYISVRRPLTAAEKKDRDVVETTKPTTVYDVRTGQRRERTPHDDWQDEVREISRNYNAEMQDYKRATGALVTTVIDSLPKKNLTAVVLEFVVCDFNELFSEDPMYILEQLGIDDEQLSERLNGRWDEQLTNEVLHQLWPTNEDRVRAWTRIAATREGYRSAILADAVAGDAKAQGLIEPVRPDNPPEPWQNADGEWITDGTPKPELPQVNPDQPDEPLGEGEAEAIAAELAAAAKDDDEAA